MVDDVLVGEFVAVLVLGLAQHRQQVGALGSSGLLDARVEVVLEQFAGLADRATT